MNTSPGTNMRLYLLPMRLIGFALVQTVIFLVLLLLGHTDAWSASGAYWTVSAAAVNAVTIVLLVLLFRHEGKRFWDMFAVSRSTLGRDILAVVIFLLVSGPVFYLPNMGSAILLYGDAMKPAVMLMQKVPLWAGLVSLVIFPVTIVFAELPFYFGYLLPRLRPRMGAVAAVILTSTFLALQHCTLPLVFDARFLLWRFLMFLPFALLLGGLLAWRIRLLPYVVVIHGIMDALTGLFVFMTSIKG